MVRSFVRVEFGFIQFALGSFYAVHIIVLQKEQVHSIRLRKKIATLFTFTFAVLGILPPTRCLRCTTDGSA